MSAIVANITRQREADEAAQTAALAYEDKMIGGMLDAFDRALEADGDERRLRADFKSHQIEVAAMVMNMHAGSPRKLVASFVQLAGVWLDLSGTPPMERAKAGVICEGLAQLLRDSRNLGGAR